MRSPAAALSAPDAAPHVVIIRSGERPPAAELIRRGTAELLSHVPLIRYLIGAELKRTHADTAIGRLWWAIDPLVMMAIYLVLFEIIRTTKTPDFPLFLFSAILPWKWFSTTLAEATVSVRTRTALIKQLQFPKIVLPAAAVGAGSVSFLFGLLILVPVALPFAHRLSWTVLLLPLIAAVQLLLTFGLALLVSAANAFYADVQNVLTHVLRILFYLTPILWSLDTLAPESRLRDVLSLNPMAPIVQAYRAIIWGTKDVAHGTLPDFTALGLVAVFSVGLIALAMVFFKRLERSFARVLS